MINIYNFFAMDESEKAMATLTGIFLAERKQKQKTVSLYRVNNFYVEIFRDPLQISPLYFAFNLESTELLVPYLEDIIAKPLI